MTTIRAKTASRLLAQTVPAILTAVAILLVSGYHSGAAQPVPTTICIVDDSNGNQLRFDKITGEYTFTDCNFLVAGTGTVTIKGSVITLTHIAADRRLTATVDQAVKRAKASLLIIPTGALRTIVDRNTADDVCVCGDDED